MWILKQRWENGQTFNVAISAKVDDLVQHFNDYILPQCSNAEPEWTTIRGRNGLHQRRIKVTPKSHRNRVDTYYIEPAPYVGGQLTLTDYYRATLVGIAVTLQDGLDNQQGVMAISQVLSLLNKLVKNSYKESKVRKK